MTKTVLDAGSGPASRAGECFPDARIIRLDADPAAKPDIIGDICDIELANESVDAIYSSHVLEHLPEFKVGRALAEFHRVLRPGGELRLIVPDLKAVAVEIANDRLLDTLYESPAGPIRPLDVVYGHQGYVQHSPLYAHRTGFTGASLSRVLGAAGFIGDVREHRESFQLFAETEKPAHDRHPEPVAS